MFKSFSNRFLLLAPDEGGAAGFGGAGGEGGAGAGGAGGEGGAGAGGAGAADIGPAWTKGWEGVEADLLSDPSLKAIGSPAALLKSYVHGQRHMGRDKVVLPNDKSTQEERDQFYQKLGVPLEEQKYLESVKFDKEKNYLGEDMGKEFAKAAHGLRILPDQAAKLYEFFNTNHKATQDRTVAASTQAAQTALDALQAKLGPDAYGVKLTKATNFIKENAPELFEYMGKTGLGKDAVVVDTFMKLADKFMKEEQLPAGQGTSALTIDELQGEVNNMMMDMKGAYHNSNHPDHSRQVEHMLNLQTKLEKARSRA